MSISFSENTLKSAQIILSHYPNKEAALLPLLHLAQKEFGYISLEAEKYVAQFLQLPLPRVHSVVTFYTMFSQKPLGKYHIQICKNISCSLLGAHHLIEYVINKLKIKHKEVTEDKKFSLELVECLGSCGTAPVIRINETFYENLTKEKVDKILNELK